MSIKLSDLTAGTRTVTVKYGDVEFEVTFKADFYTPAVEAQIVELKDVDTPLAANARILSEAIQSWNVTDDNGNEIKPTEDVLRVLGVNALNAILSALTEGFSPKPLTSS